MNVPLNLPPYPYRLSEEKGKQHIYDDFRKKWVVFTPEEWVRQHILHFLVNKKKYLPGLISIERKVKHATEQLNRYDVLCYNQNGQPYLLVECKNPDIEITHDTLMQAAHYNMSIKSPFLVVSNGLVHYSAKADFTNGKMDFLDDFPEF
jgi:hypothetical protein